MSRYRVLFVVVLSALLCLPAIAQQEASEEDMLLTKIRSLSRALGEVENDEEAVKLLEDFLVEYPDTKYTASVLDAIVYYLREELNQHDRAIAAVKAHLPKISDEANLKNSEVVLAGAYNVPRFKKDLRKQIEKLDEYGPLDYGDYETLVNAAFGTEDWELALELTGSAAETATPEAVKADYPDAPEETIAERSEARTVNVDIARGWALANTGAVDEALAAFESADKRVKVNYFGIPSNELHHFWGRTLMMKGDNKAALEKLLTSALWAENEDALEAVRKIHGSDEARTEEFGEYLFEQRLKRAKSMQSFAAVDYTDTKLESKDLMGKVTLVAFWFPT